MLEQAWFAGPHLRGLNYLLDCLFVTYIYLMFCHCESKCLLVMILRHVLIWWFFIVTL